MFFVWRVINQDLYVHVYTDSKFDILSGSFECESRKISVVQNYSYKTLQIKSCGTFLQKCIRYICKVNGSL